MEAITPYIVLFVALFVVVLAARQMGDIFARYKLPLISGFLFVGILTGPFVLDFIHEQNVPQFLLLDELALAFIAFAAGAELELHVIRGYFRSIIAVITGQVVAVFALGIAAFFLLQDKVPFMAGLPQAEVLAIALLGATIMIARSPSSALAIIKELRARGPFTHKVLGATVLKDAVVILIFAASVSVAAVLVEGGGFAPSLLLLVIVEILLDIALGVLVGLSLQLIVKLPNQIMKSALILLLGLSVFLLSNALHGVQLFNLEVGFFSEPLLICMTAGFYVANYSTLAADFQHTIEEMAPAVFLLFFTLVGIELELDVLGQSWQIVLVLFAVRLVGIFIGSFAGVTAARDRSPGNAFLGLGFITQAGVSVGLAKEIAVEFGEWGPALATLSIGVIVVNQVVGPPVLKWAITQVGEARLSSENLEKDGGRDVVIFGIEGQSLALARQLQNHQWNVVLVACKQEVMDYQPDESARFEFMPAVGLDELQRLRLGRAESVVLMLSDEENFQICELIYENFGVKNVIVRLQEQQNMDRFLELGAKIVQPGTAMVHLLDQFVRSPFAASLFLGLAADEEFRDLELNNAELNGMAIRDIHFPHDVLVVAVARNGSRLDSAGYTRLELGDLVTVMGSPDSLNEIQARFEV